MSMLTCQMTEEWQLLFIIKWAGHCPSRDILLAKHLATPPSDAVAVYIWSTSLDEADCKL